MTDAYITQMKAASSAFDGVSFHCYSGNVTQQDSFAAAYPSKALYFTECASLMGTDWWSDLKVMSQPLFPKNLDYEHLPGRS